MKLIGYITLALISAVLGAFIAYRVVLWQIDRNVHSAGLGAGL